VRYFPVPDLVDVILVVSAAHREGGKTEYCDKRHD
jgi:hypothetical protein